MGHQTIAGLDEAGRGSVAGPVMAAAVILPAWCYVRKGPLAGVRDSKLLSAPAREELFWQIKDCAVAMGVGTSTPALIDAVGIVAATRAAMAEAVAQLSTVPDFLLVDFLPLPDVSIPQRALVYGDARCLSIAAASVIAKVTRDRLMKQWEECYPGYGFARHKGYATPEHLAALERLGPCPIHRRTFAPMREREDTGR